MHKYNSGLLNELPQPYYSEEIYYDDDDLYSDEGPYNPEKPEIPIPEPIPVTVPAPIPGKTQQILRNNKSPKFSEYSEC